MVQKIIKIGSSAGVIIPKKQLDELGLKVGDLVEVYVSKPGEMTDEMKIIQELQEFMKIYGPALKKLAER